MYTTIIHPLRKAYNLSLLEYCVLDSVWFLSKNNRHNGWCVKTKQGIADDLDVSKQHVIRVINALIEKGLIEKDADTKFLRTVDEWNEHLSNKSEWLIGSKTNSNTLLSTKVTDGNKMLPTGEQNVTTDGNKMLPKNNIENNKENNNPIIPYGQIVDYLNAKTGSAYKPTSRKTQQLIRARFNERFTVEDFRKVIDVKVEQWGRDSKMKPYLRPETLFGTKFESYLNEWRPTPNRAQDSDDAKFVM